MLRVPTLMQGFSLLQSPCLMPYWWNFPTRSTNTNQRASLIWTNRHVNLHQSLSTRFLPSTDAEISSTLELHIPMLGVSPLGSQLCWGISPYRGQLLCCWDFPHLKLRIATLLLEFFPLRVDASNMSMGDTPLQVLSEVTTPLMGFFSLRSISEPNSTA